MESGQANPRDKDMLGLEVLGVDNSYYRLSPMRADHTAAHGTHTSAWNPHQR